MDFKKTRWMNVGGAICWALVGLALLAQKSSEQTFGILATIVVMYALLVAVPACTARALSTSGTPRLQRAMKLANWAIIALWVVSVAATAFIYPRGLGQSLVGVIAFVIPEVINLRALNRSLASPPRGAAMLEFPSIEA